MEPEMIYVDDDVLNREVWEMLARRNGRRLRTFSSPEELMERVDEIDRSAVLFFDSDFGEQRNRGEDAARRFYELGFHAIYLATGYDAERFKGIPWIKGVVGKEFPASVS